MEIYLFLQIKASKIINVFLLHTDRLLFFLHIFPLSLQLPKL